MKNSLREGALLLIACIALSCGGRNTNPGANPDDMIADEDAAGISTNIDELRVMITLAKYNPDSVKFVYTYNDNSGKDERLAANRPSDDMLQAILYFDSLTMAIFHEFDQAVDYDALELRRETFAFGWLPEEVTEELMGDSANHGHHDRFFRSRNGVIWILKDKVLLFSGGS